MGGITVVSGSLELDHLSLPLLVSSQLEVLGPLERHLHTHLAHGALHTKDNLFGGLGLERIINDTRVQISSQIKGFEIKRRHLNKLVVPEFRPVGNPPKSGGTPTHGGSNIAEINSFPGNHFGKLR